jgi:DNA-binding transcriptional ArsR family regulator
VLGISVFAALDDLGQAFVGCDLGRRAPHESVTTSCWRSRSWFRRGELVAVGLLDIRCLSNVAGMARSAKRERRASSVVVGVSYELLVVLYRKVQAEHGLPAQTQGVRDIAVPDRVRSAADWFFRGDIALGMNIIRLACERGWHDIASLVAGIDEAEPAEVVQVMLRSPDVTVAGQRRREHEVARILDGARPDAALLAAFDAERFDVSAVERVLTDPIGAVRALAQLIDGYGQLLAPHEESILGSLSAAAADARALLDRLPFEEAAQRLFPQWKFGDSAHFTSIVLIPSLAITPFLSYRAVAGEFALVVFPVPPALGASPADLAFALKALSHPQRLEILRIAAAAPITGHALARATGLSEATVHHHTSLLRAAGLLTATRDAHRVYHSARPDALARLLDETRALTGAGAEMPIER